ncbi:UNVERIFIED_CONTAM: hypothetical protein FKN15_019839 [Acipenser sinensis]
MALNTTSKRVQMYSKELRSGLLAGQSITYILLKIIHDSPTSMIMGVILHQNKLRPIFTRKRSHYRVQDCACTAELQAVKEDAQLVKER